MCYSVQPRDQMFVKGYGFLPFAKNMRKKIGKKLSKNVSGKILKNFYIMLNNMQQIHVKLFQKIFDLIDLIW